MIYGEFLKTASEYVDMHKVPPFVARAAYNVYCELPEKSASIISDTYEKTEDPMLKLAFEMIAANLVKESFFIGGVKAGLKALGSKTVSAAGHPVGAAGIGGVAAGATKKNTLEQKEGDMEHDAS